MKVKDVMSTHVDFVNADTKVRDIALLIFGRGINGVPVVKDRKIVGFVTEKDILSKFYPTEKEYIEDPLREGNFEGMEEKIDEIFSLNAEKVMSQHVTTVTEDTPLLKAQSKMFIKQVGRLPVIDNEGHLVGIISAGDIFSAMVGDRVIFTENQDYNDWLSKTYYAAVDTKDRMSHEIPDLVQIFSKNKAKNVLDVGCGTGDHVIELAQKGFNSVGTDRSAAMIREANKRKKVNLKDESQAKAHFYYGETNEILPSLGMTFDAALFMGNTISHNPNSIEKLINDVCKYLSKNAVIVMQITNFDKALKTNKGFLSFSKARLKNGIEKEYGFLEFYDMPDLKNKTILKTFAILRSDVTRWKWIGVRNSKMAYSNKEYIKQILKKKGFRKISFYGGKFDGRNWDYLIKSPFKPLESDWLNIVAER